MLIQYKIIAALVAVIALAGAFLGYGHHQYQKGDADRAASDQVVADKLKLDAAARLAAEVDRVHAAEQKLQDFINKQELKDAEHKKVINDLADKLRLAGGPALRLRDPNATDGCRLGSGGASGADSAPANVGADHAAKTGGLLSAELTGLLQQLTREADEVNLAYASCRADAFQIRQPSK